MTFIHCADLHLDARCAIFPKEEASKAAIRRDELLKTFSRMVEYAKANNVRAILISGDMFDTSSNKQIRIKDQAASIIKANEGIDFLYLRGNHDADDFFSSMQIPNLKTFDSDRWTSYEYADDSGKTVITGRETGAGAIEDSVYADLLLDTSKTNVVMLHGTIGTSGSAARDEAAIIDIKALENKGIDYLALGHIHKRAKGKLGKSGVWCYPGCLEGRGFDECGEKGFVVFDVKGKEIECRFQPNAKRTIYELRVMLKGEGSAIYCPSFDEIKSKIDDAVKGIESKDIVRVVLCGEVSEETNVSAQSYLPFYEDKFFLFKIKDETAIAVNWQKYQKDISLKGEFIRMVQKDDSLDDAAKGEIIRAGLCALKGETIE